MPASSSFAAFGLDSGAWRKVLSLALAAWLSFLIASRFHVQNAYWAAMPVWVLIQPSRGLVIERGIFRIIGTVIGAAVGFALVHLPVPPLCQLALLAVWIAVNAGLTHVMRGVSAYGALLAGMTAAIVVIPSVLAPDSSMMLAVARVECTLIGVIVSCFVLALLTPHSSLPEFYSQMRAVSADAIRYSIQVLRKDVGDTDFLREEQRILHLISQLEAAARVRTAGSLDGYRRLHAIDLLVVGSLSTMAATRALHEAGASCSPAMLERLERIAVHMKAAWNEPPSLAPYIAGAGDDPEITHLENAIGQILAADLLLSRPNAGEAKLAVQPLAWLAPHREWALAWQTGAIAGIASFIATAIGLVLHWIPAELTAVGVCIFVMVLGSIPLPQIIAPKLVAGVAIGVVAGIFYRVVVQPGINTPTQLLLTIIPFMLVGSFARIQPRVGPASIDMNMCFFLAAQVGMAADPDVVGILVNSAALIVAAAVTSLAFILLPRNALHQAHDAVATIRRDLLRILEPERIPAHTELNARYGRQILRMALHLGRAQLGKRWPAGLLAPLNLGKEIIRLQQQEFAPDCKPILRAALECRETSQHAAAQLLALAKSGDSPERTIHLRRLAKVLVATDDFLKFGREPKVPANVSRRETP